MNFHPNLLKRFRAAFTLALLVAACTSYAFDSEFTNQDSAIYPITATRSNSALANALALSTISTSADNSSGTKAFAAPVMATNTVEDSSSGAMDQLDDKYKLAVGDSINFQVIEDEDDPQPISVTDSGDIELPYIGRYPAAGKTCKQLAAELKVELQKKYFYQATVIISVRSMASKGVIYLMGGVRSPGPLELPRDEVLTVSKAILRAGGFDDFADQKHVQVTRKAESGTNTVFVINVSAVLDKGDTSEDRPAEPGDLIYVPEKTFRY
jgi:protein involved in polysaccharide export with SLBB domain